MRIFIIFSIIVVLFPIILAQYIDITTIDDLILNTDKNIYAGKGEVCITPYSEINCKEGLECTLISTTPYINGICLDKNYLSEEDYFNSTLN